ncbi:hypothetical protein KHA80_21950 [Anaerobacillus sp. HL2]|nr:hypothetical protein KHA80_21950 [Anaerobacillus sp. HL2]
MLQNKLDELINSNETFDHVNEDLAKIEQEILTHTNGHPIEELDFRIISLINPAIISLYEEFE